ncbi:MAG: FAD:protein FMN transferase [Woeseia sp.]
MRSQSISLLKTNFGKDKPWLRVTLATVVVAICVISIPSYAEWLGDTRPLMGTEVSVHIWHEDAEEGMSIVDSAFEEVARIEGLMSTYIDESEISEINRIASEGPVRAGDELINLILRSLDISMLTHGAFDITYDSVGQHYDFRARRRPDTETVQEELKHVDYRLVEVDRLEGTIRFRESGVRINLGGIAKGYSVERAVGLLRSRGIRHGIVTAGGDSRLLGDRRGQPFMVGIRDPRKEGEVVLSIPLEDEAISTSGDYERYFEEDGKRYHHIIEPATGLPAGGVRSATIVGPDAVLTDALSTSVFVLGVDRGLRLIATLPDYEGIVIDAQDRLYYSDGLEPPEAGPDSPE